MIIYLLFLSALLDIKIILRLQGVHPMRLVPTGKRDPYYRHEKIIAFPIPDNFPF